MFCVVTFLIFEAIAKFLGSVIVKIARDKVAFKEFDSSDTANINVKFLFTKLVGPSA